ncbi:hypothetical protein B0H11DRAFT_2265176 [Mycena galericulata]|nr:hypothetical protein B0H11DRAFT_2265176 [Mycena galericulata]
MHSTHPSGSSIDVSSPGTPELFPIDDMDDESSPISSPEEVQRPRPSGEPTSPLWSYSVSPSAAASRGHSRRKSGFSKSRRLFETRIIPQPLDSTQSGRSSVSPSPTKNAWSIPESASSSQNGGSGFFCPPRSLVDSPLPSGPSSPRNFNTADSTSDNSPYRLGQVVLTTSSVFVPLFLACFDAAPRHVSTADLLAYQERIRARDRPDATWRPCIIAELPKPPEFLPKVYLLTTLASKPLSSVPHPMAHWVIPVNTQSTPTEHRLSGIDITPQWRSTNGEKQWLIPFAFRPTCLTRRRENAVVDDENMGKIKIQGGHCARRWRDTLAGNATLEGTSWRLMKSIPDPARAVANPVTAVGELTSSQKGSPNGGGSDMETYMVHSDSAQFHADELKFINEQMQYHRQRRDDLSRVMMPGCISAPFMAYHTSRIRNLKRRKSAAEENLKGHTLAAIELWTSLHIPEPFEASLRVHQLPPEPVDLPTRLNSPIEMHTGNRHAAVAPDPLAPMLTLTQFNFLVEEDEGIMLAAVPPEPLAPELTLTQLNFLVEEDEGIMLAEVSPDPQEPVHLPTEPNPPGKDTSRQIPKNDGDSLTDSAAVIQLRRVLGKSNSSPAAF